MRKKVVFIILGVLLFIGVFIFCFIRFGIRWLFSSQYNEKGVSHFLVVTIDKSQPREFVGELDGYKIYVEHLNLEETNFRNIDAENVPIKKAIDEKLVSIAEWKKYAWKIKKEGDLEILKYDNYEIACFSDTCIIRPLSS